MIEIEWLYPKVNKESELINYHFFPLYHQLLSTQFDDVRATRLGRQQLIWGKNEDVCVTSALCIVSTGTGIVGSIEFKLLL